MFVATNNMIRPWCGVAFINKTSLGVLMCCGKFVCRMPSMLFEVQMNYEQKNST